MAQARFQKPRVRSFIAEVDMSAKKYHAVKLGTGDNEVDVAGAGEGIGILMNSPEAGEFAEVAMLGGGALGHSGTVISKGTELAAAADGRLIAAVATDVVVGIALSAAGAADKYFEVERVFYVK